EGTRTALPPRQRQVLVASVLEGVPIDVLAERLGSNRNALYKLLHDARRRLRAHASDAGLPEVNEGPAAISIRLTSGCSAATSRRSTATGASRSSTATSSSSSQALPPTSSSRPCAPISSAVPRARKSTRACARCSNWIPSPERAEMHTTKYLIVGAGMTGDMAAKGIREQEPDGSITMIGADPHAVYKRPLLT